MTSGSVDTDGAGARRYRAFLSYSHANEREAHKLHRWLETYRLPARLIGMAANGGPVPRRLAPIFRDRAELAAASSLNQQVRLALSQSDALLVVCSPAAKASRWVEAEIALFRELHPDRPVIAALVEGEPADSFPAALLGRDPDGAVHEPIAADFRPDQDGKRLARLKIVAGLTGVALDQIIQRDAQRQMRHVIVVTFLALLTALLMALMLIFVARARNEAEEQRQQAEGLIEFMLTDLRDKLEGVGRLDVLQTVNKRALAYYARQPDLAGLPLDSLERRARILQAMGEDDLKRGDRAAALAQFREAYRVTNMLLLTAPQDAQRLFAHAQSEFWLGYVDFMQDRNEAALPRFRSYRSLAQRLVQLAFDGHIHLVGQNDQADQPLALGGQGRHGQGDERVADFDVAGVNLPVEQRLEGFSLRLTRCRKHHKLKIIAASQAVLPNINQVSMPFKNLFSLLHGRKAFGELTRLRLPGIDLYNVGSWANVIERGHRITCYGSKRV